MLSSLIPQRAVRAKLLNDNNALHLLAAFNASSPPVIWLYDLKKSESATIRLQEKEGEWDLGVIPHQGSFSSVAHFDERHDAEAALAVIKQTVLRGRFFPVLGPWIRFALVLLALLVSFGLFVEVPAEKDVSTKDTITTTEPNTKETAPKAMIPGIPMKADDVLTPPID